MGAAPPSPSPATGAGPALELVRLTKVFAKPAAEGGVCVACDDVSLAVPAGEVVAVVGENGAGKSTLMNLAYGLYRPTSGSVRVGGRALELGSPRDAIAAGVGMVHQHFMLVGPLTIAENVALGAEPRRGLLFDRARAERAVAELSDKLGFGIDPRAPVASASVATQQRVEIVKVLYRGARVLILDEPTAALAPAEAEALLESVRALAAEGKSVVLISHKLREVLAVASRVAVMRRGRLVAERPAAETSAEELAGLMVGGAAAGPARVALGAAPPGREGGGAPSSGREGGGDVAAGRGAAVAGGGRGAAGAVAGGGRGAAGAGAGGGRGAPVVALRGATARNDRGVVALKGVDLELFAGEIVAVAGVDGNGQTELAEVLVGLRPLEGGTFERSEAARAREAVAHVPEDRQRRGLCLPLSVEENLVLGRHRAPGLVRQAAFDVVDAAARRELAARLIEALDVRPTDPGARAESLSGGNQQKIIVARELLAAPPLLPSSPPIALVVAVQPTRGLDLGAIANVHARLREARDAGAAVLVVSLDLDEVRALGDRIVVMAGGRVAAELPAGADEALVGRHMLAGEGAARA
ncbi:MAG TPA: ATP-binding cassette domain-containing protein [Polyangiaceae bacterium]|nr:ATP-binding cassette domain-containing protein [Polyangiaceae bacterium]